MCVCCLSFPTHPLEFFIISGIFVSLKASSSHSIIISPLMSLPFILEPHASLGIVGICPSCFHNVFLHHPSSPLSLVPSSPTAESKLYMDLKDHLCSNSTGCLAMAESNLSQCKVKRNTDTTRLAWVIKKVLFYRKSKWLRNAERKKKKS